jgi:hypothetical protein
MKSLVKQISEWNVWTWSVPRWFGLFIGILAMWLIGHHSSYWVSLGIFLWSWSMNIDRSGE